MKNVVHAACPHDCPDACGVLITVEDGRATKIQGDPGHPVTRGFLCAKVAKYLDRVYSPDRVLYPMRRIAAKGLGRSGARAEGARATAKLWQRISWDEALDEIAFALSRDHLRVRQRGDSALFLRRNAGSAERRSMDRRFFHRLGASQLERTICSAAGEAGLESVHGREARHRARAVPPFPLHHCLGCRTFTETMFTCGRSSRRRGARARSWW